MGLMAYIKRVEAKKKSSVRSRSDALVLRRVPTPEMKSTMPSPQLHIQKPNYSRMYSKTGLAMHWPTSRYCSSLVMDASKKFIALSPPQTRYHIPTNLLNMISRQDSERSNIPIIHEEKL